MTRADVYKLIDAIYRQMNHRWNAEKPAEIFKIIMKWRRENGFPQSVSATVSNGCLYLNGEYIERIAYYVDYTPRHGTRDNDAAADYYEELILARQE